MPKDGNTKDEGEMKDPENLPPEEKEKMKKEKEDSKSMPPDEEKEIESDFVKIKKNLI